MPANGAAPRWRQSLLGKTVLFLLGAVMLAYGIGASIGFIVVERISRDQWWNQATIDTQISTTAIRGIYTFVTVQNDPSGRVTRIVSDTPLGDEDSILQTGFSPVDVLALASAQTLNNVWLLHYQPDKTPGYTLVSADAGSSEFDRKQVSSKLQNLREPYTGFARINGHEYFVNAIPIATRLGKQTGALISSIGTREQLYRTRNTLIHNALLVLLIVLLAATLAIIWLLRRLFGPVPTLIRSLIGMAQGDIQTVTPHQGRPDEIGQLADAIETLRKAAVEREQLLSIRETAVRLEHMAHHDALTGLPNRAFLNRVLTRMIAALPSGDRFNLMLFDLDRFKPVNDSHGHAAGDALLVAVGDRLNLLLGSEDLAVRLGGDEFVVVQTVMRDAKQEASKLAERILEALQRPFLINGVALTIGTSIGVALAPDDGDTAHDLLKHADAALYAAKNAGRGRYLFHEPRAPGEGWIGTSTH
ncbi:GGDEF domain-containing protein [Bordetella sp. FB-8]|uniref:GGDEF domain-containing protein n=1 Tax=Bordetella sp. FB-8 TaxID=1159870 RepID=UPI001E45F53F|nr:GGDEF domain-containing protein [Bordetella sp. FB-8]